MKSRFSRAVLGAAVGFATALCALPAFAAASDLPEIPFEKFELENGLEVILHEDHSTPIVGVNMWYHVGSKNEKVRRTGFAHLFEHMMFQGSVHQDVEYISAVQGLGGQVNGSTSEDRTNYWEVVPAGELEGVLLLQADRMGWLLDAMTQEKLDNQKMVVRNERRESEGEPYAAFWLDFNRNFYPKGHPYDHSVIGEHEDLEAATLDDVKDFFRQYYTPNNATLVIAGDFDAKKAREWTTKYFAEIAPGPPVAEVETWIPTLDREMRFRYQDRVELPRLSFVWHTPPAFAPEDATMSLAAKVLGQGRTSRLYRRLVHEEKLAQEVSATQMSQQISSAFMIDVTLKPDASMARVEEIVSEEIGKLTTSGPTKEELQRAKNDFEAGFIKSAQRIGSWGGRNDRLNRYNHYVGTPDYFRKDYESYMTPTEADVRDTFARWIGPGRMVIEFHPYGEPAPSATFAGLDRRKMPAASPATDLSIPTVARGRLASGATLAVLEQHELPIVRVDLLFKSGTAADPAGKSGLCDLAAAMLLEGTNKRDKFEFEAELESMGTELYYFSQRDGTTFSLTSLEKHLDRSLALLAEALTEPAFPASEFADEKDNRLVNIRREGEDPYLVTAKATRRVMYGASHPYTFMGTGTIASMEAMSIEDARAFAKTHFTPGNATIVAVGDVTLGDLEKRLAKAFSRWEGAAPAAVEMAAPPARSGRTVYLVDKPGDTQSTISIAQIGMSRSDPNWEKLVVANHVFGGFFSSRLNLNLREDKGYSYGVRSQNAPSRGPAIFSMGGRVQADATAPSVTEFLREMEEVRGKRPITQKEFEFSKSNLLQSYAAEFETVGQLAGALSTQAMYGLPDDNLVTYPKRLASVDLPTANATAKEIFHPDRLAIIVVGDLAKIEGPVKKLNLGPIVYLDSEGNETTPDTELSSR